MDEYNWDDWDQQSSDYLNSGDYQGEAFTTGDDQQWGGQYEPPSQEQGGYNFNVGDSLPQGMYDFGGFGGDTGQKFDGMSGFQQDNPFGAQEQNFMDEPQYGAGGNNQYLDMFNNALKSGGGVLNSLFAPKAGGEASTRDVLGGLAPFLAALYNKNQAPKTAAAANQYIQGQQQRLDPFQPYRQGAGDEMLQRRAEIEALMKDPTSSSMYNSQYNTAMQEARAKGGKSGQRFAAFMPRASMYNAQKSQADTLKQLQGMYMDSAKLAGSNINPAGLEALLAKGMASNMGAADPWQGMFGALGQMSTKQAPAINEDLLRQLMSMNRG